MRLDGWEQRLDDLIVQARKRPFAWGTQDCMTFAMSAVDAVIGQDPMKGIRGRYATQRGAGSALARYCGSPDVERALEEVARRHGLKEIPVGRAGRGAIVVFRNHEGESTAGIVALDGISVLAVTAPGALVSLPLSSAYRAWAD